MVLLLSLLIPIIIFGIWYIFYGLELAMNGAGNDFVYNPIEHLEKDLYNFGTLRGRKSYVYKLKIRTKDYEDEEVDDAVYYNMLPAIWYPWVFHGLFFSLFTVSIVQLLYRIFE